MAIFNSYFDITRGYVDSTRKNPAQALDFREQLECNGQQLMLPAPRATPAVVQKAVTKVGRHWETGIMQHGYCSCIDF